MKLKGSMQNEKVRKIEKDSKQNEGITLIALVVTIVVLLILAGITLTLLFGENSILKTAKEAKIVQKLAEIEDEANLIYTDIRIEKYKDNPAATPNISMEEVIAKLKPSDDYKIQTIKEGTESIIGVRLSDNRIDLEPRETKTIKVILEGKTDKNIYYIVIEEKYYRINQVGSKIQINKTDEIPKQTMDTLIVNVGTAGVIKTPNINKMEISITAEDIGGKSTIVTVAYGEKTAKCEIIVKLKPINDTLNNVTTFSTNYGKIDVIWLKDNKNTVVDKPNSPELFTGAAALKPVTWTKSGSKWNEDSTSTTNTKIANNTWYNYKAATGTTDNLNSQWANAKNTDGSYFVWIPRYAYRITYYDKDWTVDSTAVITGYYDGYGMWKAIDGIKKYNLDSGIETVEYEGARYIVHPAFGTSVDNGGWKSALKGVWVAKYEMSGVNASGTNIPEPGNVVTSTNIKMVSKPNVASWRNVNIANCYNNSYNYDRIKESHLIKNSEWGAVAYLTQSAYGRNGHEVDINNSSTFITGNGAGQPCGDINIETAGVANAYNTALGAKASTTGNIYGVYDMSGGAYEYVAAFNKDYTGNFFTGSSYKPTTGAHFAYTNGTSNAYKTAYSNTAEILIKEDIYKVSKIGDGMKEVYTQNNEKESWYRDICNVVTSKNPFFHRGNYFGINNGKAGIFAAMSYTGNTSIHVSFRIVLCP